jgi:hypothetical protein
MRGHCCQALSSPLAHSCERAQVSGKQRYIAGDSAPAIGQYQEKRRSIDLASNDLFAWRGNRVAALLPLLLTATGGILQFEQGYKERVGAT